VNDATALVRTFVVGAPRSGTTLVQGLLAAHPAVASFTESHFFSRHYRRVGPASRLFLVRDPRPRVEAFLAENGVADEERGPAFAALAAAVPRGGLRRATASDRVARAFLALLDALARERGATHWVEKTPLHLYALPYLERIATGARLRFVHVVRQGLGVVASLHAASQRWERAYDVEECAQRWNRDLRATLARLDRDTDHAVLYEPLTRAPEPALAGLLAHLGLPPAAGLLERRAQAAATLVTDGEPWKRRAAEPLSPSAPPGQGLDEAQCERAHRILRPGLWDEVARRASAATGGRTA